MTGVASGHGITVAVGTDGNGGAHGPAARAWWSTDGLVWVEATGERFSGFVSGQDSTVVATRDGFLATFPVTDPTCPGGIWTSSDGRSWRCAASETAFSGFVPAGVAESTTHQVAVGVATLVSGALDGYPGAAWRRPIP